MNSGSDTKAVDTFIELNKELQRKGLSGRDVCCRLKDKGVEFYGWRRNQTGTYDLLMRWEDRIPRSYEVKKRPRLAFRR